MEALGLSSDFGSLEILLLLSCTPGGGAGGVIFIFLRARHDGLLLIVRTIGRVYQILRA
jgi:hypothetical protein